MTEPMPVIASTEEPTTPAALSYWGKVANVYAKMGPPLRPSGQDIRFLEEIIAAYARQHSGKNQAMLLGVTPDIAAMRWPASFALLGIDRSYAMVKGLWPGNVPGKRWAVNGNWLTLPKRPCSCDIVIGDGSMNSMTSDEHRTFATNIRTALKPDGIFILRCFTQMDQREQPDQVFADALRGAIPTFTQFRFRLLMAMQPSAREGVAVNSVYQFWMGRSNTHSLLRSRAGWPESEMDVIEIYRDSGTVLTFPTLAEFRASLAEFFEEISVSFPTYYAGDRCPRLVLTPRRSCG